MAIAVGLVIYSIADCISLILYVGSQYIVPI